MARLPHTEEAFSNLATERQFEFGMHRGHNLKVGGRGIIVGEQPFDPVMHDPTDIDPLSVMALATGGQYVNDIIRDYPLNVTIITEHDAAAEQPHIGAAKLRLGQQLRESLEDALPVMGDRVNLYHIGDTDNAIDLRYTEVIEQHEDATENAKTVAKLCQDGLNFVISNFSRGRLRFEDADVQVENTIGLRVMRQQDIAVPLDGVTRLGKGREAATPKEAAAYNKNTLDPYNKHVEDALRRTGMLVGRVIISPNQDTGTLFNRDITDSTIAEAISSLDYKA